jgi:hypothetical protein
MFFSDSLRGGWNLPLEPTSVQLRPLPYWNHLAPEVYCVRLAELVREIETTSTAQRDEEGPLGAEQIQQQEPETRPETLDKSPAPSFTP